MSTDKPKVLDSGERQQFSTGSQRDISAGKGTPSLLQLMAILEVSKVCEAGAVKYERENWRKGQPLSRYFDSAFRHLVKYALNWTDEPHLDQAIWNLLCIRETKAMIDMGLLPKELDDMPNDYFKNNDMAKLMKEFLGWS